MILNENEEKALIAEGKRKRIFKACKRFYVELKENDEKREIQSKQEEMKSTGLPLGLPMTQSLKFLEIPTSSIPAKSMMGDAFHSHAYALRRSPSRFSVLPSS